jgi:hypothetical protein
MASSASFQPKWLYALFVVAAAAYAIITFITPISSAGNVYNITPQQLLWLRLSFVVPILAIWWAAVFGVVRFKDYALKIKDSPDGQALGRIANGLTILVIGLIIGSLWTVVAAYFWPVPQHPALKAIIANYLQLIAPLIAFYVMVMGAIDLVHLTKSEATYRRQVLAASLWFVLFSLLYVGLIFTNSYRNSSESLTITSFWLPDSLLVTTIIVPYILVWGMGLLTALGIRTYMMKTKGILYRQALSGLGAGLFAVIVFSILLQMLVAVWPLFADIGLNGILIVIYFIIGLYAVGYLLIARGARRLKQIEEVK